MKLDKYMNDVITKRNIDKFRRKNKISGTTDQMRCKAMEKLEPFLRQVLKEAVKTAGENVVLIKEKHIIAGLEMFELKNGRKEKCERSVSAPP